MNPQPLQQNQSAAMAQVLVAGPECIDQTQAAPQICRGTSLHHPVPGHTRPVGCGGLWLMPAVLVGLYFCISHSSPSLTAAICAVSLPAVSRVCLLNTSMVLLLETPKGLLQLLLSLKYRPPVLTCTEML